jgi:hypothetical protein
MVPQNAMRYAATPDGNLCDGRFMSRIRSILRAALLLAFVAACAPMGTDAGRFLVYFDEFSANLTPEAHAVIANAAQSGDAAAGADRPNRIGRSDRRRAPRRRRAGAVTRYCDTVRIAERIPVFELLPDAFRAPAR